MSGPPIGPQLAGLGERLSQYFASNPAIPADVKGLSRDDVPVLREILKDPTRAGLWQSALLAICVLADAQDAFQTVVGHIQEIHDFQTAGPLSVPNKILSVACLGWVDPAVTGDFLARGITEEGALEVIGGWLNTPLPSMVYALNLDLQYRKAAASGLVLLRQDEYLQPLIAEYDRLKITDLRSRSDADSYMLASFKGNLAINDMIKDRGFDETCRILRAAPSSLAIIAPYHNRYDRELAAINGELGFCPNPALPATSWHDTDKPASVARRILRTLADILLRRRGHRVR
jgi:hypothetical protein